MRILIVAVVALSACGAPAGRSTAPEPAPSAVPAPAPPLTALGEADEWLLARLPDDTILVVQVDHVALAESPYRGALVGDEAVLVEAALGGHLDRAPEQTLPEAFLREAQTTTFVVTLDDVGMDDAFTLVTGNMDVEAIGTLLAQASNVSGVEGATIRLGATTDDGVDSVGAYRAGVGLAFGAADREDEVGSLLGGRETGLDAPELRRLMTRAPSGSRHGARALLGNTRALSAYLRESFAQQNLTAEIVDTFVGLAATLDLSDGAVLTVTAHASEPDAVATLADQLDELLSGLEEHPLVTAFGLSRVISERTRTVEGGEVELVMRASDETFRAMLVRMLAALAEPN